MKLQEVPQELINFIANHDTFFVIPHIEPDGDCVGSALALASMLKRLGKIVYTHSLGPFEKKEVERFETQFQGRIDQATLKAAKNPCALVVDCSTLDRIGALADDIVGLAAAVIDHHSSGVEFGDCRFINSSSPSTSLLVQQLIEAFGLSLSKEEAELIFFAFSTDTGFFRHLEAKSGESFKLVARLVDAGASPKQTFGNMNSGVSLESRLHLGKLLSRVEPYANGKILVSYEYLEETLDLGKKNRESDLLYQMLMGISGVEVVVSLREESKTTTTGGLRSRSFVDVGHVALQLGGGGHKHAAGFMAQEALKTVKAQVVALLEESIQGH